MRLQLSPELEAFREEMRTFFTTKVPQEIRDTVAAHRHVSKEQFVETQQRAQRRRARRAALAGRVGRPGLDAAAAPHLARGDAAAPACPTPLAFNASHDRPGHRRSSATQEQKESSCRRRRTSTSGGARASPSPTPAPTSPRCAPPPSATATTGSSTARRRGPRSASTATGSSAWCRTDPERRRSRPASRCCSSPWTPPASRCARSS